MQVTTFPNVYLNVFYILLKKSFFFLFIFLLKNNCFTELLFSVKLQHESTISIHISPPFWISLPSPDTPHPSRLILSPCLCFLSHTANSHGYLFYIWKKKFQFRLYIYHDLEVKISKISMEFIKVQKSLAL